MKLGKRTYFKPKTIRNWDGLVSLCTFWNLKTKIQEKRLISFIKKNTITTDYFRFISENRPPHPPTKNCMCRKQIYFKFIYKDCFVRLTSRVSIDNCLLPAGFEPRWVNQRANPFPQKTVKFSASYIVYLYLIFYFKVVCVNLISDYDILILSALKLSKCIHVYVYTLLKIFGKLYNFNNKDLNIKVIHLPVNTVILLRKSSKNWLKIT